MRQFLTIAAAIIPAIGAVPYIIDTAKNKTHPNIVTWFTWSLINGINTTALLGIPLWLITGQPELAVLILLGVDLAGGLPTLRHAWQAPHEETWQTFALSCIGGLLMLCSLTRYDIVAITMPLYIFLFDTTVIAVIYFRGKKIRQDHAKA